jgi:hypothetical protein
MDHRVAMRARLLPGELRCAAVANVELRSGDLRSALAEALAGRGARLADLLARHGGLPGARPNLALAAAFGEAIAVGQDDRRARRVIEELAAERATEGARVFLPVAAAYGAVARLGSDPGSAWAAVSELTADDRAPVRVGLIAALAAWVEKGSADELVTRATEWLEIEDREHRFAAIAIALEVLAVGVGRVRDRMHLFDWLDRALAEIAGAPRAAERGPGRRRALASLPRAAASVTSGLRGEPDGMGWLMARCADATHPDLRAAFDETIGTLRKGAHAQPPATLAALRTALASSAKPPRDPARIRKGTTRRGQKR